MPCSMRRSLMTCSGMEALAERPIGSPEAGSAGMVRSEAAARAEHPVEPGNPLRPNHGSFPDLALIGTAGLSRQCLPRDHSATGAAQSWKRIRRLGNPGSRKAHRAEPPISINAKRLTHWSLQRSARSNVRLKWNRQIEASRIRRCQAGDPCCGLKCRSGVHADPGIPGR